MTQQEVDLETTQDRRGCDGLVFGHTSKDCKEIQQGYYAEPAKRNTGELWVRLLIQKLRKTAWYQWDHRNDVLHRQEDLVSQVEANMMNSQISDFFAIGSQGFLSQDS
jgi:hypothetical protein